MKLKKALFYTKVNVTSASRVGDISSVTLVETDTTFDGRDAGIWLGRRWVRVGEGGALLGVFPPVAN